MKRTLVVYLGLLLLSVTWLSAGDGASKGAGRRRLVVCLDGTLNNPEQSVETLGDHSLYKPTNVLKTYRAVLPVAADGTSQITFYSEGVGSSIGEQIPLAHLLRAAETAAGGAFGAGFEARIKEAYRFLVANYQPNDDIFVFGFSRGAAEAMGLVRFIAWAHGLLAKDDEYYIPELFDGFAKSITHNVDAASVLERIRLRKDTPVPLIAAQEKCRTNLQQLAPDAGKPTDPMAAEAAAARLKISDPRPVTIRFLGVYETVIALGSRLATEGAVTTTPPQFAFLGGKVPPAIVTTGRQALSIDERRWDFRAQVWESLAAPGQSLEQVWFPGVHSNVGGGYTHDGLANGALQWMIGQATKSGLEVDWRYLGHYRPWVCGDRPNTDAGWLRVSESIRGKGGRGVRSVPQGAELHESVARLLICDKTYRPENLLPQLAMDDKQVDQFPEALRPQVRAIVDEFKRSRVH